MGLDSYVTAKRYLWDIGETNDNDKIDTISKLFPEMAGMRVKEVAVEAMYWRKANQIHRWFVDNVQDGVDECQESYISTEQLYQLRDTCAAVLADPSQAGVLLPTQRGFFFGGDEYGEWYLEQVTNTKEWLDRLLFKDTFDEKFKNWTFYYQASW